MGMRASALQRDNSLKKRDVFIDVIHARYLPIRPDEASVDCVRIQPGSARRRRRAYPDIIHPLLGNRPTLEVAIMGAFRVLPVDVVPLVACVTAGALRIVDPAAVAK